MSSRAAAIELLDQRLVRVMRGPEAIEASVVFRIVRPILALSKWRASLRTDALAALLACFDGAERDVAAIAGALERAVTEAEANVLAVERVAIVRRRSPVAHAAWLRRVVGVLALADEAAHAAGDGASAFAAVQGRDRSALFAPLAPARTGLGSLDVPADDAHPDVDDVQIVDLELAAIDHLVAAARAETLALGRRRRLLVAARQRLLEAAAALPLDRAGVRERTAYLAREIARIDRLEAAGLDPHVSLVHQARTALTRREPGRLFAALNALDANAAAAFDRDVGRRTRAALRGGAVDDAEAARQSVERSAVELLGADVARAVEAAVDGARADALERLGLGGVPSERDAARSLLEYLPEGSAAALLRAAASADGLFEVGGALAAVRVVEEERVLRLVRHPTATLVLTPAEDVADLRDSVIGDPRSVILDLATGRLLARRFVREERRRRSRVVTRAEARVYVLDGSGSMQGPRARVRDAILVAELSTLVRRLEAPGDVRCTLFYRYFDEELGLVNRIADAQAARAAIRDVVGTERAGGTDIEKALLASFDQVVEARAADADLARAQVVLVTDGESNVDEERIIAAHEAIGVPVGVSVIALGAENPALRALVARQRARGVRAFYHFLDDAELAEITAGAFGAGGAFHPPERWAKAEDVGRALEEEVGGLLAELEDLERERDHAALERLEAEVQARREVRALTSEDEDEPTADAAHARIEALRRDRAALAARFARWFPEVDEAAAALPPARSREREDVEAACCALASVAEVVLLLGGSAASRQADAIELLERLLPDARLTPARYRRVLRAFPGAVAGPLRAVRDAALAGAS